MDLRIHIGSISESLAQDLGVLETRISKYGEIVSPLELHKKPTLDTYFAYTTMKFENKDKFKALRKAHNGVIFKGATLSLDEAKPSYETVLHERQEQEKKLASRKKYLDGLPLIQLNSSQLKRLFQVKHDKSVVPGRLRTCDRKPGKRKESTKKVLVGGTGGSFRMIKRNKDGTTSVVRVACPKQKLWGVLRRSYNDLVAQYSNGVWKDGTGEIIDTKKASYGGNSSYHGAGSDRTASAKHDELSSRDNDGRQDADDGDEQARNSKIIEEMLASGMGDSVKVEWSGDEGDEGEDEGEGQGEKEDSENDSNEGDINEGGGGESFAEEGIVESDGEHGPVEKETTRNLRKLFESSGSFKLFGGEEGDEGDEKLEVEGDEEIEVDEDQEEVEKFVEEEKMDTEKIHEPRGLFFGHFESPFLHSQSQVSKLLNGDSSLFEKQFYENRGEYNRNLKRRRREVLRKRNR